MFFLFLVFPFCCIFSLRSDFNSAANLTSPNTLQTTACSSFWDFNNPVFCPENTWAYGFQLTNASGYGILNIALDCRNQTFDQINLVFSQSSSLMVKYNAPGSLLALSPQNSEVAGCPSGSGDFLRGYYLREWCPTGLFQTPQGIVEVRMRNSNSTDISTSVQTTDSGALWTGYSDCLSGFAVCGFDMKYNSNLLGVFYGAVDIGLKCCRVCEYSEGFFFSANNESCSFCDFPCKSCFGASSNCTDCFFGFALAGNTCVPQNITQMVASELSSQFALGGEWSSNLGNINLTVSCWPYWLIGGYPNFVGGSWIARAFTDLPSHYMVRISFRFFKIGAWQLESYGIISFDSVAFFTIRWDELASPLFYSSDCGSGNILTNSAYRSAYFDHNSSNLTINFTMNSSSGYWGINRITVETQNCDLSCQSCSINGCTTCPLNNLLTINNTCVSQCVSPYFADMTTMKCVSQCPLGYFGDSFSQSCVLNCPHGEFKNMNDGLCYFQCPMGFGDPFSGFCVDSCPVGMFGDSNSGICEFCDFNCLSCSQKSVCTECQYGWLETIPYCSNPNYTYHLESQEFNFNSSSSSFLLSTSGWVVEDSLTASLNYTSTCGDYFLLGGNGFFGVNAKISKTYQNLPPHLSVRVTFIAMTIGNWSNNSLNIAADSILVQSVLFSPNVDSPAFKPCGDSNFSEGLSRIDVYFNHSNSNLNFSVSSDLILDAAQASWGVYNLSLAIFLCDASCQTCAISDDATQCLSCVSGLYLQSPIGPSSCKPTCQIGYFVDTNNGKCGLCDVSCKKCSNIGPDQCLACSGELFLQSGFGPSYCLLSCPAGTYPYNNTCQKCESTCLSCQGSSSNECLSCISGLFLQSKNSPSSCLSTCPKQTYPSTINNSCLACDAGCSSCVGPLSNQCLSCDFGLFLQSNAGPAPCLSSCPGNTYRSQTNNLCIPCDSSCLTCAGSSSNDCLSCSIGMFLTSAAPASCQSICSLGYFFNNNTSNCEACDSTCSSCSGAGPLFCITYQTSLSLNESESIQLNQTQPQNHNNAPIIITPSILNTTHPLTFLLMFSGFYSTIYEQYLLSSNISIDGFDSSFLTCKITQIEQTKIFMVDILNVNFSIQGYPLMHFYLNPSSDVLSNNSIQLSTYTLETPMEYYFFITPNDWQVINQTTEATDVVSSLLSNVFIFSGFFLSGSSTVFSCMLSMDSIRFLRHFQINYPANVASVFHSSLPMLDLIPNFYLDEDPKDNELPQTFQSYGISKYVFNNCGNTIIEGVSYWGVGVISLVVAKSLKNCDNKVVKFILYLLLGIFVWNLTIGYFLANYISITFYTVLALKYTLTSSLMGRVNLVLSIFFCCFVAFLFPFSVALIRKIRLKVVPVSQTQYQQATFNDFDMMRASVDMRSAKILPVKGERKNSDPLSTTNCFPSLKHVLQKTEKTEDLNFIFGSETNFSTVDMKKSSMTISTAKTSLESPPIKYKKSTLYVPENKVTLRKKDVVSKLCQNVIETAKNVEFFNKNDRELKRFETLHKDFKQRTFWQSYFIVWSLLKNLLYCLTIINFYDNPKVGLIVTISLNGFYIVTLLAIRPFKKNVEFLQNLYNELGVYAAMIILIYMFSIDEKDKVLIDEKKLKLGWGIVICNSLLVAGFLVRILFSWGGIALAVSRNIYNKMKERALRRRTKVNNIQDFCMKHDDGEKLGNEKNYGVGMDKSIDL